MANPKKEPETGLNLYQRIREVMREVEYLNKDKQVGDGGFSYKAVSEESVTGTIREKMIKHGLAMMPVGQVHKHEELPRTDKYGKPSVLALSTVDVTYKLVNVDAPDEYVLIVSSGTGVDSQDKGVGKAMTYAMKYALLRAFMVPTGNDPDSVHNDVLERNAPAGPDPLQQAIFLMQGAADMDTLKQCWSAHKAFQNAPAFVAAKDVRKAELDGENEQAQLAAGHDNYGTTKGE